MAMALAHELNQPLTALIGFARACQGVLQAPAAAAEPSRRAAIELIDQTVQQAARAGEIIRGAREFLRHDDSRRVRIEARQIVEVALDLMRGEAAQHGVRIEAQLPAGLPPLLADPIQIEQVLLNLLRNSIDATTRGRMADASIVVSAVLIAGTPPAVEFAVRDTGPGFPAELTGRLFQPFATTRSDGMGLGLSISRSIVEAHGGRIWLAASSDRGAEIRFTVPIDHGDADAG
jgi:two-component system, LuxR family, sensor kinase FixL